MRRARSAYNAHLAKCVARETREVSKHKLRDRIANLANDCALINGKKREMILTFAYI